MITSADPAYSSLQRKVSGAKEATRRVLDTLFDKSPIQEMSRRHGLKSFFLEGYMDPQQFAWFADLYAKEPITNVVQTGFNAGHSAFAFAYLGSRAVTSFDINEHSYVQPAHDYLERRFPWIDFRLVLGDSVTTVPEHQDDNLYDLAFIDGGHSQEVAVNDIANLRRLTLPGAYVVMDDYGGTAPWQIGPTAAYEQAVSDGLVTHLTTEHTRGSDWALGKYT
jgi:predicted O-methyltransferase YrrM